jgi:hypothetical protein
MSIWQGQGGDVTVLEDQRYRNATAPADLGYLAWSSPLDLTTGVSTIAASGTIQAAKIHIPAGSAAYGEATVGQAITAITVLVQTGNGTATASQSLVGLYTAAGVLIGSTASNSAAADLATAFASTGIVKSAALTVATGQSLTVPAGDYYIAIFQVATTPAIFRGNGTVNVNGALAATASKYATAATGNTTTMPTALGTISAYVGSFWVAVS